MKKKTIIITGGGGFLGSEFSKFLSNNYYIICLDKDKHKLLKIKNKNIKTLEVDITSEKDVQKIFKLTKNFNIYGLINNAAIDAIPKNNISNNLKYPSLDSWLHEISVSIFGSFLMIKYFGENMFKLKRGSIINIGSDLSLIAPNQKIYEKSYKNYFKPPTYSVIKHGLLGMTKYYASLYAKNNVRVNMISPGPILNNQNATLKKNLKKLIPMNKLGEKSDLLGLINFLIGENSKFITGQNIFVDGGRTII